ncbi:TonB-dependent receptor family protein [Marinobacter sp. JSM 1782161]|uniref:TonB-dependent receptor family protein n=1 Tax=Marinobacter sp. JSM 1782161 TaxID=2685906 RepID=UPI001403D782|nr:TonB-dependent receptor [Marinobacter sp. JSM 1782161]
MPTQRFRAPLLLALSASPLLGAAQTTELNSITVTSGRLERELYDTPAATSVVEEDAIAQGQQRLKLDESLGQVPGVFLQNRENYAQGERVSIRGFGARAAFGVRGVTVLVDGIPYTLPDGQAQLDAIDLNTAESIEVIRGPASVLYGNAAGGVLSVTTPDGRRQPDHTTLRLEGGSDGYGQFAAGNSGENGPWSHNLSVSALNTDGYRDHSHVEKYLLNGKLRRDLGDDRALTAVFNLLDNPRSEDPGALTAEQVEEDREQAGRFTEEYDTGQSVDQQVLGLQYQDLSAGPGEWYVKTFYLRRNFKQQLPYPGDSLIHYDRDYFGASTEYRQSLALGGRPLRYVAGVEARRQRDDRGRREVSFAGDIGGLTADEVQTATAVGAFAQTDLDLTDKLTLSLGGRFDRVELAVDDHFPSDGNQSGEQTFREWSGSAGLSYRYRPFHQVYANVSTAFETPTFSEFANPSGVGGFNPDIEPQQSLNRELGLRGDLGYGVDYDVTLFWVDVRDELIPYELPGDNDRTFYRNAGDTSRKGVELALGWRFAPQWRVESALTLARYRFDDYTANGNDYDDNRIPGLPERTWNTELHWNGAGERFAALETRYVGDMKADDANTVEVDDYWLLGLRGGDGWYVGRDTLLKAYAGIRNLLDEDYFANVRINASNDRYFEPASGRTWYAGIELTF